MGIGPSSKETTLHHYGDPLVEALCKDEAIDFLGIVVEGTPENHRHKQFVAERAGEMVRMMGAEGAIVSIDSWRNSHIDFTSVIQAIGEKGIPVVGLSFVGHQASFVVTNPYVETIIDLNKTELGIETRVVGENTATVDDAFKAVELIKHKIRKKDHEQNREQRKIAPMGRVERLTVKKFAVNRVIGGEKTAFEAGVLRLGKDFLASVPSSYGCLERVEVSIIEPQNHRVFVNSILDVLPIAVKVKGKLGEGLTHLFSGVKVLLTAVENTGFQPANIGSSEGLLCEQLKLGQCGTPSEEDLLIHVNVVLREGEGRTRRGIMEAHQLCDEGVQVLRRSLLETTTKADQPVVTYAFGERQGGMKVVLIKLISGLGCMYDTALFPNEPAGYLGSRSIMDLGNMQVVINPNEYRDGAVRSMT